MHRPRRLPFAVGAIGSLVVLGVGTSIAVGTTQNKTDATRAALDGHQPKNVIFFLGDGMGTQEITAARYYRGVTNKLNVDRMPFTGFDQTWSVKADGTTPDYDPDSAATGTQWATGKRTTDDRDSQGPSAAGTVGDNQAYKTVLEDAQEAGKKVGDVTTADLTDATPAVLAAHISNRNCSGPDNMSASTAAMPKCVSESKLNGGLGSIAEQEVDHQVDVMLGGGEARFRQTITAGPDAGKTVVESAQGKGIDVVTDAAGLAAADASKPVLGLFGGTSGRNTPNMSLEWKGTPASLANNSGAGETCQENQRPADEPSLSDMTTKAISLLDQDNDKGFFLQVEGASIDKQDHAANACQQIGETIAFDNAIGKALDYQQDHPDTLVVVTADHGHSSQIVAEDVPTGNGRPTGYSDRLKTADGQTLAMTYGTAGFNATGATGPDNAAAPTGTTGVFLAATATSLSQQHTGTVVPVWGIGPQASNVLGTNAHTDLFDLLRGAKDDQAPPPVVTETTTTTTPGPTVTGPTTTAPGDTVTTTTPGATVTAPGTTTPGATVTTTVPGPATPSSAVKLALGAARSISRSALGSTGLPIAATGLNAGKVKVTLKRGSRTVASKTVSGGAATLKVKGAKAGTYKLTLTGGGKTVSRTVKVS